MIKGAEFVSTCLPTQLAIMLRVLEIEKESFYGKPLGYLRMSRDSSVSMTEIVCAEDDVNLRVSTGLLAAIDKGYRR